jgi:hypothetical protein
MPTPLTCDLHTHSTASDGTDTPRNLPLLVKQAGLAAFALTDHDTTAGLEEARKAAEELGIGFIPGVELSADPDVFNTGESIGTLHLLGYAIAPRNKGLLDLCEQLRKVRAQRNPAILAKLNGLGVRITVDEVIAAATLEQSTGDQAVIGRPHIARVLIEKGYVRTMHEAFQKYLGMQGAAYVRKDRLKAQRAIDAIHQAGGVAVLAHPVQLKLDEESLEHTLAALVDLGLDGIEVLHSDHEPVDVERFTTLAERFNLLTTGGSDYHGSGKSVALGSPRAPIAWFEALLDYAGM